MAMVPKSHRRWNGFAPAPFGSPEFRQSAVSKGPVDPVFTERTHLFQGHHLAVYVPTPHDHVARINADVARVFGDEPPGR
jgi:hypothetical protein